MAFVYDYVVDYWWLPGTLLMVGIGVYGVLAGVDARALQCGRVILGLHVALLAASVLVLLGAGLAWLLGGAYAVWFGLLVPGLVGVNLLGWMLPLVIGRYRRSVPPGPEGSTPVLPPAGPRGDPGNG